MSNSDDSPFERLHRQRTGFRWRYDDARRVAEPRREVARPPTLVFGRIPGIKLPGLSLVGIQNMGPIRHALTQRVVAGTMDVRILPILPPKKDPGKPGP